MDEASEDKSGLEGMAHSKGVITFRNVNFPSIEPGNLVLSNF